MTLAELTNNAADFLEKSKWGRGQEEYRPGTVCMMEAVELQDPSYEYYLYDEVEREIRHIAGPEDGTSGTWWNDKIAKDKRDAVRMLRKVAKTFKDEGR